MLDTLNKVLTDTLAAAEETEEVLEHLKFDSDLINNNFGWEITIVGMLIVFISLALLSLFLMGMTKYLRSREKKSIELKSPETINKKPKEEISGEVSAAISLAIYIYSEEQHDIENTVLTIRKVNKSYSPWSSKIYGLRKIPRN